MGVVAETQPIACVPCCSPPRSPGLLSWDKTGSTPAPPGNLEGTLALRLAALPGPALEASHRTIPGPAQPRGEPQPTPALLCLPGCPSPSSRAACHGPATGTATASQWSTTASRQPSTSPPASLTSLSSSRWTLRPVGRREWVWRVGPPRKQRRGVLQVIPVLLPLHPSAPPGAAPFPSLLAWGLSLLATPPSHPKALLALQWLTWDLAQSRPDLHYWV